MVKEEYKEIQKQFNKVIAYSQDYPIEKINSDDLFEKWQENKQKYIKAFDGLIWTYPEKVAITLNDKAQEKYFNDFLHRVIDYRFLDLHDFLVANGVQGFFENRITKPNLVVKTEKGDQKVQVGTKLMKCFKFFVKDKETRESFINEASRIIQLNKVEGTLCFSVHPLDFLSTSENDHGWRSCHALDGEYKAGNLSYMGDACTIVCYLRSDENTKLPRFPSDVPWNNKKWRVLLFFSDKEDMMFAGRQYPFASSVGLDIARKVCPFRRWENLWRSKKVTSVETETGEVYLDDPYIPVGHKLKSIKKLVVDTCHDGCCLHYNDLLKSTCYDPVYTFNEYLWVSPNTKFVVGSEVKCLSCNNEYITDPEYMFCEDCADYDSHIFYCCNCGERTDIDERWTDDDGNDWCEYCWMEHHTYCEGCNQWFADDSEPMQEINGLWLCSSCYDETMRERGEEE